MLSGLNTDRGRVFLSLGPPNRTMRLASTRTFVPIEVWYFDEEGLLPNSSNCTLAQCGAAKTSSR